MRNKKQILIIGLDGFDPTLAAKWMIEGRLPALAQLAAQGRCGPLCGLLPPATYPAWTSCVTGVNPGRHGILDFTVIRPERYGLQFVNSTFRRVPALWNILSDAGFRVCIVGVPGTYPPEPVNGILVSGFDSPVADAPDSSFVFPCSVYPRIKKWRFANVQEHRISVDWYRTALDALLQKIADQEAIALELFQEEQWGFFMVVFGEADTVSHHFWPLEDEQSPRRVMIDKLPSHPIRTIYERLDRVIGQFLKIAEDAFVVVVSDHGFGGAHVKAIHLNNYLSELGWLSFSGNPRNFLKRFLLTWLPIRGRGSLFRRFKSVAEQLESRSRFSGIDWRNTRAWSEELDYFPSVRLNGQGLNAGIIENHDEYEKCISALCSLLQNLPGIAAAWPRNKIYEGPATTYAPDIILEPSWKEGYRYSFIRARGGPALEILPRERWLGGKEGGCSGVHRNPAFIASNYPFRVSTPSLLDIAPTVLDYFGVVGPPMEGISLLSGLPAAAINNRADWTHGHIKPYTKAEETLLEQRMRTLGYFE